MRFLDTSKALLDAILSVLPAHLEALRSRRLINAQPVRLRLWHFDQQTTKLGEMILGGNSAFATTDLSPLRTQLSTLQPGGVTNYACNYAAPDRCAARASLRRREADH